MITLQIRKKDKYIVYDESLKKHLNITASSYTEELGNKFKITRNNTKNIRLCNNTDYKRVNGISNYTESISSLTNG